MPADGAAVIVLFMPDELTADAIRARMAIPSTARLRGLKDGVGFATTPEAMAAVYAASALPPYPAPLGPEPDGLVVGAICPHDDFLYAGRVYRRALERITAKTVIIVGTHHGYRNFKHGLGVVDSHDAWWTPDGPARCSPLRDAVVERAQGFVRVDDAAHDQEHSIEPIVAWLKHQNPDVEIVPILPPGGSTDAVWMPAQFFACALRLEMDEHGLEFGKDVAIVVSADAIHYGPDFAETRFGAGGPDPHARSVDEDHRILREYLTGELGLSQQYEFFHTLVDERDVDRYRWTWCGRFAIPFGWAMLETLRPSSLLAWPLAYETSMSAPRLTVDLPPLGVTAPASYEHFVGYPAVAFTFGPLATDAGL